MTLVKGNKYPSDSSGKNPKTVKTDLGMLSNNGPQRSDSQTGIESLMGEVNGGLLYENLCRKSGDE